MNKGNFNKNPRGGRPKLSKDELKLRVQFFVTPIELERLDLQVEQSHFKSRSSYLEWRLVLDNPDRPQINQVELLQRIDSLSAQMGRIGSNINQLAKIGNTMLLQGRVDTNFNLATNELLTEHINIQKLIKSAIWELILK